MNRKAKGNRNENKSKRVLEELGYDVMLSRASKGTFDLIAISESGILCVQVKSNGWPSTEEVQRIRDFKCPANVSKVIHNWVDGESKPRTKLVR